MDTDLYNKLRDDSQRIYSFLISEMTCRFSWFNDAISGIVPDCSGLPTVLLDDYVFPLILKLFQEREQNQCEINDFFAFIEQLLIGTDQSIIDVISTTIIEKLASETEISLDVVLPYCKLATKRAIIDSVYNYYKNVQRAKDLERFTVVNRICFYC